VKNETVRSLEDRSATDAVIPVIVASPSLSLSSLPAWTVASTTTSSSSDANPFNQDGDGIVPDSFVSSSVATGAAFSSLTTTTNTTTTRRQGNKCSSRREWRTVDWCWLKENEEVVDAKEEQEQEMVAAEDVDVNAKKEQHRVAEEANDTALSSPAEGLSPRSVRTHTKQTRPSHRSGGQVKRKNAAATSAVDIDVDDEDSDKDYQGDNNSSEDDCKADYESAINDESSNSEMIQGPKIKKARKELYQEKRDKQWDKMYQSLLVYKAQHGNTLVPRSYDKISQLGAWVHAQRKQHAKKKLASNRVLRLDSIGFVWCLIKRVSWESMFQLLLEYKAQHGNTLISQSYDKNPPFGRWVDQQRQRYSKNKLESNRVLRLESIGFAWYLVKRVPWESMFQLLLEYKNQHGDTLVPLSYDKNPALGSWVTQQRQRHAKKQLSSNRVLRLESIGFVWCLIKRVPWESMFQLLLEYKDQHGNTEVPRSYDKNPRLSNWVRTQRYRYSQKQLLSNRLLRLESIGFVWGTRK